MGQEQSVFEKAIVFLRDVQRRRSGKQDRSSTALAGGFRVNDSLIPLSHDPSDSIAHMLHALINDM